jgi:uncharacterized membrane protein YcaP (DUF421 family)
MFFNSWSGLGRTAIVALLAYASLVLFLRLSGKRTLSQKDPFDFVIVTALGSTLAQTILSKDVVFAQGLTAFATLIGLQFISTWLSMHSVTVQHLIKSDPTLLFYRGQFLHRAMEHEHVPEIEILAAIREQGIGSMEEVEAVVLEADSGFSVIRQSDKKSDSALADVDFRYANSSSRST